MLFALWTTWLFVRMNPSGVKTKPEPVHIPCPRNRRRSMFPTSPGWAMMFTTDGLTFSTAEMTARE